MAIAVLSKKEFIHSVDFINEHEARTLIIAGFTDVFPLKTTCDQLGLSQGKKVVFWIPKPQGKQNHVDILRASAFSSSER